MSFERKLVSPDWTWNRGVLAHAARWLIVNRTAVLHSAAAVSFVAAILVQQTPIRIGLGVLAVAGLVGGIVLARRDDSTGATSE